MRILVLEDDRSRIRKFRQELIGHVVDFAEDVHTASRLLAANEYAMMFLDHDLGQQQLVDSSEQNTGYQFAVIVAADERNRAASVVVHSCNPAGADNMAAVLPSAVRVPFPALDIAAAARWAEEQQK